MFDPQPTSPPATPVVPTPTPVPAPAPLPPQPPMVEPPHDEGGISVFRGVLIGIFVLALVGGAGYAAWRLMLQEPSSDGPVRSIGDDGVVQGDEDEGKGVEQDDEVKDTDEPSTTKKPTFLDSDGDGLTNAEELEAGTDVNEADTDRDGLGDREEVKVYATDPGDPDTDNDSFLDGQEVAGGYNPNGDGKLFNVPTE